MRACRIVVVMCVARVAAAGPYDVGWVGVGMGLGASPALSGGIADRLEREPCETRCPLSSRMALAGGIGRWGVEVQMASSPLVDAGAADHRDRQRQAVRAGVVGRMSVVRGYGVDLSVRAGVQRGVLGGSSSTTTTDSCVDGICESIEVTYTPRSYTLWAFPIGATLRLGVRAGERGYVSLFADYDYSIVDVAFDDGRRSGALRAFSYGFLLGTMFDLR